MNSRKVTHFTARERAVFFYNTKINIIIVIILSISEAQESHIMAYVGIREL